MIHEPRLSVYAPAQHQRRSYRYARILDASLLGAVSQLVKVVNISTCGVGLHHYAPIEVNTLLTIQVYFDGQAVAMRQARVVRSTEQENGTWFLGAALAEPFTESEFRNLLATDTFAPPSEASPNSRIRG